MIGREFEVAEDSWRMVAACRGADANLFLPLRGESTLGAKLACRGCDVRVDCLTEALVDTDKVTGIRGGLSEKQQRILRREVGLNTDRSETDTNDILAQKILNASRQVAIAAIARVDLIPLTDKKYYR